MLSRVTGCCAPSSGKAAANATSACTAANCSAKTAAVLRSACPAPTPAITARSASQTMSGASGFAEYTNALEAMVCKLDDDIPYVIGSVLACGFMSGFGAVLNRSKIKPGESCAVVGCGGVGLSAIMGARWSGAIPIIAIDTMDVKLEAAKKFGATHLINPKQCDVVKEVKKITRGFGVDHSVVATAGKGLKTSTFALTAGYGQMVIIGHGRYEDELLHDINGMEFLAGKRITGSVMGSGPLRLDIPLYMEMYRKGLVDIGALLTRRFPLERIQEAHRRRLERRAEKRHRHRRGELTIHKMGAGDEL